MPTKNRTVGKVLSTSNQDIYVAPARWSANVYSIVITNTTSSVKLVSLEWYDTVNTTWYYIMKDTPVIANGLIQIEEPLYLNVTDKIRGLASVAESITVSVNVREDFTAAL